MTSRDSKKEALNVLLVGKTGSGKSSVGNLMLGREAFLVENGFDSATDRCQAAAGEAAGRRIVVVDTPGTLDTRDKEAPLMELTKMIRLSPEGFHAFLIVVKCGTRYTDEEHEAIEVLRKIFGDRCLEFSIVVFTHGGVFDNNEDTLRSKLDEARHQQPRLNELMSLCGDRLALVDSGQNCSQTEKKRQVDRLVGCLCRLETRTRQPYTNEMFEEAQKEMERLRDRERERQDERRQFEEKMLQQMEELRKELRGVAEAQKEARLSQRETEIEMKRQALEERQKLQEMREEKRSTETQMNSINASVIGGLLVPALQACVIQ